MTAAAREAPARAKRPRAKSATSAAPRTARAKVGAKATGEVLIDGARKVSLTHPERVLFPEDGLTKGDLVHYYRDVAPFLLPYLKDRPLTLQRYPAGIHAPSFFEKNVPLGAPPWLESVAMPSTGKRKTVHYPLCNDAAALLWAANMGAITLHVWMSRVGSIAHPDYILFDLDPFEGCTVKTLAKVALHVRGELESIGLPPLVKTTGGKGLHVLVPLEPVYSYDEVRGFGELLARRAHDALPELVTLDRSKVKRAEGTVYMEWVQLGQGKTLVPPFVVRAREGAPVSMPLAWSEVEAMESSRGKDTTKELRRWSITNVPRLLAERGDPWAKAYAKKRRLEPALKKAHAAWGGPHAGATRTRAKRRGIKIMAAHAIWSGTISFGLVSIPVKLFTAVRESEGIHFSLLHGKDEGKIHNLRKCDSCGKEVPWSDVVKGYEVEKGQYVVVTDEEIKSYRPEATQSIDIVEFVDLPEIDPMLYDKPYYIEPEKKGRHAYGLLREALRKSGKVGIAKVVLRTREYLAAVRPNGNALVLEMMHFANEIVKPDAFDFPPAKEKTPEGEMKAAMMLIDAMAKEFDATEFHDKYREELKKMLEARAEGAPPPKPKKGAPKSNVLDLMAVLQKSLSATKAGPTVHAARAAHAKAAPASRAKGKKSTASKETRATKRKAS